MGRDQLDQRGGAHHAGEGLAGVDRVDGGGAVLPEGAGERVGVAADEDRLDGVTELARPW